MYVFSLVPIAVQYAAILATIVLVFRCWSATRATGFAVLGAALVLGHGFALVFPHLVTPLGTPTAVLVNSIVSLVLAVLNAFAWWRIHAALTTARVRDRAVA